MTENLFVVVDGNNVAMRGVFALWKTGMTNPQGEDSRALFGLTSALKKFVNNFQPSHMLWTFDRSRSDKRLGIDKNYKGNRNYGADDDLRVTLAPQYRAFEELLTLLNIPFLYEEGQEADDLMARAVHHYGSDKTDCLVVSGDGDLLQLASDSPKVSIHQPGKDNTKTFEHGVVASQVEEWFGVPPVRIPEIKAIIGDKSDNITGIKGLGPKRALRILQQHGDLFQALKKAPELVGYEKLVANNFLLTELESATDPLPLQLEDCALGTYDEEPVQSFFDDWGFSKLKPRDFLVQEI